MCPLLLLLLRWAALLDALGAHRGRGGGAGRQEVAVEAATARRGRRSEHGAGAVVVGDGWAERVPSNIAASSDPLGFLQFRVQGLGFRA
jgi:hypothetical protein